jgi:hypothetical protein
MSREISYLLAFQKVLFCFAITNRLITLILHANSEVLFFTAEIYAILKIINGLMLADVCA